VVGHLASLTGHTVRAPVGASTSEVSDSVIVSVTCLVAQSPNRRVWI
jgi:hypothetical protein